MGCTNGLLGQSQLYTDRFCANMLLMNLRVEAAGYPHIAQDIFCENSEPHPSLGALHVANRGHTSSVGCPGTAQAVPTRRDLGHPRYFIACWSLLPAPRGNHCAQLG